MNQISILIVEDEAIVAEHLSGKLEQLGYAVAGIAAESQAAVDMALRLRPQLILMDIQLEGQLDGIQAAEAIQARCDVPVIYLTAHSDSATIARAKLTGPFGYILKPFEMRDLATQIELALYKHKTDRQLREHREWLRVTLTSIGDAVIATDARGAIAFLNPVAESLTGWKAAEAAGRLLAEVFRIINEQTGLPVEDPVACVLRECRTVPLANHTAIISRHGRTVPIEDSAAPIMDAAGQVIGVVLVFHDVTQKRRAQEALRESEKALRELNRTLEQQVDERTKQAEARSRQLQVLTVQLIETEERERRRVADYLHDDLQQMLAAAWMQLDSVCQVQPDELILANVRQLLEKSIGKSRRLSYELSPPVLQHANLIAALQWIVRYYKEQFGLNVELTADEAPPSDSAPIKVFLFRAVQELLFNVVKHAEVKSARIDLARTDGCLVLTVSDQGQGLNPQILDATVVHSGFGLLSLRERARYIGGNLSIESAPALGSRVTLTVPLRITKNDEPHQPTFDRQPDAPADGVCVFEPSVTRVLFVDDHKVMRQGLINLIGSQPGIRVAGEASNGREAIDRIRQLRPDVVVMDVSMPEMDGIEATRHIKAQWPEVRVIGLSMADDEHISRTMREAGAEAYVSKTASSTELLKAIFGIGS